jgi:hypothetical protein
MNKLQQLANYRLGFADAVMMHITDKLKSNEDYLCGYEEGKKKIRESIDNYSRLIGYEQQMIRTVKII